MQAGAPKESSVDGLECELRDELFRAYGPMMTGKPLFTALGYISDAAFRMSLSRGEMPVPIFNIENRKGKYALVKDVARFIAEQRFKSPETHKKRRPHVTVDSVK